MKKVVFKPAALVLCILMGLFIMAGCGSQESSEPEATDDQKAAEEVYKSDSVTSDMFMAGDIQKFVDSVDLEYGYDLTHTLAYDEKYWDNELGWRSAGSDAEHACADFLEQEMKDIGLTDVEKVGVDCDKFQFNDSSLTLEGTDIDLIPAAYQCSGTDGDLKAEIVDCGTGFEADYDGKDVKGKIALVGVDQWNEAWIDVYIGEAKEQGAAALVTYSVGGYGTANDDTVNVQDICSPDYIPTVAISKNQADEVLAAIKDGNTEATLNVDAEFEDNGGTTYNVAGKIKGKSSDQQIIVSGHYDKYWYGFQDDCAAIGLVFTVAKAMVDAGYKPENDIVFVAHGAEEWGVSGSCADWTTGAWQMVDSAKTDWGGKTIAMLNCELPGFKTDTGNLGFAAVPEYRNMVNNILKEGLVQTAGDVGLVYETVDATTMEDGVSYRWHGVPYFINSFLDDSFMPKNYHTAEDNESTYDADSFNTNINTYGALAIYIDNMPAVELDLTQGAADILANFNEEVETEAGADVEAYKAAADEMSTAAAALNDKIKDINDRYIEAIASEDEEAAAGIREEGTELNKTTLKAFAAAQQLVRVDGTDVTYGHTVMTNNVTNLSGVIEGLKAGNFWGEEGDGALDHAYLLNQVTDYNFIIMGVASAKDGAAMYHPEDFTAKDAQFTYQRMDDYIDVGETTYEVNQTCENEDFDAEKFIPVYEKAREEALAFLADYAKTDIENMNEVTKILSK